MYILLLEYMYILLFIQQGTERLVFLKTANLTVAYNFLASPLSGRTLVQRVVLPYCQLFCRPIVGCKLCSGLEDNVASTIEPKARRSIAVSEMTNKLHGFSSHTSKKDNAINIVRFTILVNTRKNYQIRLCSEILNNNFN